MRALVLLLAACGGSSEPPAAPVRAPISLVAPADGSGDAIVARVNGAPVWASCVAAQAGGDRARGLRQCEDFELLAQAAAARGLQGAPEVTDAADAALVNRMIATTFEPKYADPSSIEGLVDQKLRASGDAAGTAIPEGRASAFIRVVVAKGASPEVDAAAHAYALELAAPLLARTGLYGVDLTDTAKALGTRNAFHVDASEFRMSPAAALDPPYAAALFSIPEVGRIASAPVRTKWGWDIVLATAIQPAHFWTRAELVAKLFPDLRRAQLAPWVDGLGTPTYTASNWRELLEEHAP